MYEKNVFIALASSLVSRGEDMEVVARDLALAFKQVVEEGVGPGKEHEELARFLAE